jgi:quinoprotein glucose dehydrogenase
LREGLGRPAEGLSVSASTPGVVFEDMLILPSSVPETLPGTPGHIRAFDVKTGKQRWIFHTIPQPGELGYDTWPKEAYQLSGGANAWAGLTVDQKLGMVFAATGSASFDFYGTTRHGDNLFANCVLALDARSGKRVWHFQALKHDIWDWDFPSPPSLVTVKRNGRSVDAVAQVTKFGYVFVLDPRTGKSLFPIEYRKAPPSSIDGEKAGRGAAVSDQAAAVRAARADRSMLTTRTPEAHAAVLERFRKMKSGTSRRRRSRARSCFPGSTAGGVGRRGVRSRIGLAVRQLERDAVDHQDDPEQRHLALQLEVRDLPSRGSHRLAGGAVARRHRQEDDARRDRDDHPAGHRPHAGVSRHGRPQHHRCRGIPDHRRR